MAHTLHDLVEPDADALSPGERLASALELHAVGEELVRARVRLEHPDADEAQLAAAVEAWRLAPLDRPVPAWARLASWPRR